MRIITGQLGGRKFESPHSPKTHPMSDKIRGALFNVLGDIEGLTILDAFAGSGALSFEAISRGAHSATAIDNDRDAQQVITDNIQTLRISGGVKLIRASASAWLQTNPEARFDIVLCDPPYNDLQPSLIARLTTCLQKEGVFVLSWPAAEEPPTLPGLKTVAHHSYGDAQLFFFTQTS